MTDIEDWRTRFARLRSAAGGAPIEDLHYRARQRLEARGETAVSLSLMQKRLAPASEKQPTPDLLRTLAAAVEVAPEEFAEYRLALARESLDENVVGLEAALRQLTLIDSALAKGGRGRRAAARELDTAPHRPEARRGRSTPSAS